MTLPGPSTLVPAARAMPATTGFTNSRWLGFGAIDTVRLFSERSAPAWYFTSPAQPRSILNAARPCTGSLNSARICTYGFDSTCASTLRRPRCAMPSSTSEPPAAAAPSRITSRTGISMSRPSIEKRVLPGKARCRNCSNASTWLRRSRSVDVVDRLDRRPEAARLSGVAQPVALLGHEDVRVVVAGGGAVDPPQRGDRLERVGRGGRDRPGDQAGRQARQHPVRHAVERSGERRIADRRGSQRIERSPPGGRSGGCTRRG